MSNINNPMLVGRNAHLNLAAGGSGIVLQSFMQGKNMTDAVLNDSTCLIDDIRGLLEKLHINTWSSSNDSNHLEDDGHLLFFADQIDSKAKELALNASMILEELVLYSSSPTIFADIDSVEMTGDLSQLDESNQNSYFNFSLTVGDSWLQDIDDEVSIIESWEVEAEKLSQIAIAAFHNLRTDTSDIMETATSEAMTLLETTADEIYRNIQMKQHERLELHKAKHHNSVSSTLLDDDTWKVEEVVPTDMDIALETIKSLPLKTYKLRDDKHRDLGVSEDVRRTRYHVGVIDRGDNDTKVDPSSIFSYNIGATARLALSLEQLLSKAKASASFFHHQSLLKDKVSTQTKAHSQDFKSPSQLASEVAALETEAALSRIARLSQSVLQSVRVNQIVSRFMSQLKQQNIKSQSSERLGLVQHGRISTRENHAEEADSLVSQLLLFFESINTMEAIWNSTRRELVEMTKAANVESHIAKEEIHAEAAVERENESTSLEQIRLVGRARVNEITHAIEQIFWHLTGCLQHIMTPEGRQQFLFYAGAAALLVFVVSTLKEVIGLCCICILRFFTAPRLVREYGNLKTQVHYWFGRDAQSTDDIVLPPNIKDRIDTVVKVASAATKRRFPLRSVLIHGNPGSGKSVVAKAIAQSISLPYALMSGADVYPMGSQGPAELRALLTWASKSGGIIIIDEAESLLGSRSKHKKGNGTLDNDKKGSSPGYSQDCLNCLLSMTGSNGNIMLILTTQNPGQLDEAVLDRMDEMIHLPLPSKEERSILLNNQFFRQFEQLNNDHPSWARNVFSKLRPPVGTKACFDLSFDVKGCLSYLASETNGFSGRELEKIIQGVLYKTYSSDKGVLDMALWRKETMTLVKAVSAKHALTETKKQ